ncbi:hypothetical protein [Sulfolobus tengchongensis spindle-shaped virus 4]|nr:hypothetical protein [Sulfolobus tengchongensis spindle-shaped virus 4]
MNSETYVCNDAFNCIIYFVLASSLSKVFNNFAIIRTISYLVASAGSSRPSSLKYCIASLSCATFFFIYSQLILLIPSGTISIMFFPPPFIFSLF